MKYLEYAAVALCVLAAAFVGHLYLKHLANDAYEVRIMELETRVATLTAENKEYRKDNEDTVIKLLQCQGPGMKLEGIEDVTQK